MISRLLAFCFRRPEAAKEAAQFGLFGTYARAASAANPTAWGGGGAAAQPGTHVEVRTDKTGRTEHRTVKDAAPAPAQAPAGRPAQLGLFGGATPVKRQPLAVERPQRVKLATRPMCNRCGGNIPKFDEHADGKTCGTCLRTVDWITAHEGHPSFAGMHG